MNGKRFGLTLPRVVEEAIGFASDGTAGFHVSFDVDGIDPVEAPGVGTPVPGGLNMRESHLLMEMVADSRKMVSLEFAELNPIHDNANATGRLVCDLIASGLGKKVMGPMLPRDR